MISRISKQICKLWKKNRQQIQFNKRNEELRVTRMDILFLKCYYRDTQVEKWVLNHQESYKNCISIKIRMNGRLYSKKCLKEAKTEQNRDYTVSIHRVSFLW